MALDVEAAGAHFGGNDDPIIPLINARVMARLMPNAALLSLMTVLFFS